MQSNRLKGRGRKILVLYRTLEYPLRATIADHLFSFRRWSDADCIYVNVASQPVPHVLARMPFDLIVFHTTLLSSRVRNNRFQRLMSQLEFLSESRAVRIALPQDEHVFTTNLCEFIERLAVDNVLSVAPKITWPAIYDTVDRSKVAIHQVLTGYLEPRTLRRIEQLASTKPKDRAIDVGYRAHGVRHNLGYHGQLKIEIARAFLAAAQGQDLRTDISTQFEDTFLGDSWYQFLLRCRYVLGIEGGASLHDPTGEISRCVQRYVAEHPHALFDEVEAACFPGSDGAFPLVALSPRHLEAVATRTGQLLVSGDYNGILEPGTHYVPIDKDLGNLGELVRNSMDESDRLRMVERAYDDIVVSGRYTYQRFVDLVLRTSLQTQHVTGCPARASTEPWNPLRAAGVRCAGWIGWLFPLVIGVGARALHVLARRGPRSLGRFLRRVEKRVRGK
ncbi:MAG: hypothetical protein E4H08_04555 [Candidatus Atribacteria bacterium]|nr:MAG: hypothetical protein E4H08_04555 [Candidatus Atribacteria bacterium]